MRLEGSPSRTPGPPQKPDLPSSDEARISPTQEQRTIRSTAPDHRMRRGFDLRTILSSIFADGDRHTADPHPADQSRYQVAGFVRRYCGDESSRGENPGRFRR